MFLQFFSLIHKTSFHSYASPQNDEEASDCTFVFSKFIYPTIQRKSLCLCFVFAPALSPLLYLLVVPLFSVCLLLFSLYLLLFSLCYVLLNLYVRYNEIPCFCYATGQKRTRWRESTVIVLETQCQEMEAKRQTTFLACRVDFYVFLIIIIITAVAERRDRPKQNSRV